jgi:hypothetical protein
MRTKRLYQFVSLALIGLPLLVLVAYQERLPDRLPLHFDEFGQTDQLVPRQQWINKIISSTLLLNFLRIVFMSLLSRQPKLGQPQLMKLHLSTAVLTAGAGSLAGWARDIPETPLPGMAPHSFLFVWQQLCVLRRAACTSSYRNKEYPTNGPSAACSPADPRSDATRNNTSQFAGRSGYGICAGAGSLAGWVYG